MDYGVLAGIGLIVSFLAPGVVRVIRDRRSGAIQTGGHPVRDQLLLLASALVLVLLLGAAIWITHGLDRLRSRLLVLPILALTAVVLTALSNRMLLGRWDQTPRKGWIQLRQIWRGR